MKDVLALAVFAVAFVAPAQSWGVNSCIFAMANDTTQEPSISQPLVREPVPSSTQEKPLDAPTAQPQIPWKPGDPVKIRPDLKKNDDTPKIGPAGK
jgi:hypothetical protein